ncbi:unnamed protein product [Arctogadus glacialis]
MSATEISMEAGHGYSVPYCLASRSPPRERENDATECTFDLDTARGWEGVRLKVTEGGVVAVQPPSRPGTRSICRGPLPVPSPPTTEEEGSGGDGVNPRYQE